MSSRREFLQLLGLGGVEAASLTIPIPVFGSDESPKLWTPDQKIVGGHTVLVRPENFSRVGSKVVDPIGSEATVSLREAWPVVEGHVYWGGGWFGSGRETLHLLEEHYGFEGHGGRRSEEGVGFPLSEDHTVEQAHAAFYKGAESFREKFKQESLAILKRVPESLRPQAEIVTLVDNPVWADAYYDGENSGHRIGDQQPGFTLRAAWSQYVIVGRLRSNGWETYSEIGQFPIDVPKDFDMGLLLRMGNPEEYAIWFTDRQ